MKFTTIFLLTLASLSPSAVLADDFGAPTPTPTPVNLVGPGRHDRAWQERVVQRNERHTAAESRAQAHAQQQATRAAAEKSQAQIREAVRTRAEARREVAAEAEREVHAEKPQPTSDLMRRMGFSEQDIAAQKAREQSTSASGAKPSKPASPGQ